MKKLLTTLLCAVLCVAIFMMTACGGSIFDGNYKAIDQTALTELLNNIGESEEGESYDYSEGYSMKFNIKMSMGGEDTELSCDMKFTAVADDLVASGSMNLMGNKMEIYYAGGWAYMKATDGGQTIKQKQQVSIDTMISSFDSYNETSVGDAFDGFVTKPVVTVDQTEEQIKIKFEMKDLVISSGTTNGDYYYVFDKDYKLLASKSDFTVVSSMGQMSLVTKISGIIEPFTGTITAPSDLDAYELYVGD